MRTPVNVSCRVGRTDRPPAEFEQQLRFVLVLQERLPDNRQNSNTSQAD